MGIRCADHVTPLYPQKLVLTSPTGGARSVGIVRSRTKATEFFFLYSYCGDRMTVVHCMDGKTKFTMRSWVLSVKVGKLDLL